MSLCSLCKDIPWETLPEIPPDLPKNATGHEYIRPIVRWPRGVRGYPHHQSFDALRQSSSSCGLCSLICGSAERVQNQLDELRPKWEAGETNQYDQPTFELWIVKREVGGEASLSAHCGHVLFFGERKGNSFANQVISQVSSHCFETYANFVHTGV